MQTEQQLLLILTGHELFNKVLVMNFFYKKVPFWHFKKLFLVYLKYILNLSVFYT